MPSPRLEAASRSARSENQVRREHFIQKQIAGLRALGLSEDALKREEKLLRGGLLAQTMFGPDGMV
jgi:hypothetical protein